MNLPCSIVSGITLSNCCPKPQLLHYGIEKMDWSFFATAHGNWAVDGVGALLRELSGIAYLNN